MIPKFESNPLTKIVKEGDIVLFQIDGWVDSIKQICRLKNVKYFPPDEQYSTDWIDFDVDVLYTSMRMHPSMLNDCIGNCFAMKEIVPEEIVEMVAKNNNLWKANQYMMSDEELAAAREMAERKINIV